MTNEEIKAESREYADKKINLAVSMYNPAAQTIAAQAYEDGIKKGLKQHAHDYLVKTANQKVQLTKAKQLLNEFMRISKASDEDFEHDYTELISETEQFINSEVEK